MTAMSHAESIRHKVVIIDDHPIVRQGLRRMLEAEADFEVVADVATDQAARRVIREMTPDAAIVDLALQEGDGIELVRHVHAQYPQLRLLVLSMHDENIYAERLLAEGASGYIMKEAASEQVVSALRSVLRGEIFVSEAIAARRSVRASVRRLASDNPVDRLSNRELQVLNLVGRGVSTREIAIELGLSVKTVESHRQSLKRKLSLATNTQLVQYAINWFGRPRVDPPAITPS